MRTNGKSSVASTSASAAASSRHFSLSAGAKDDDASTKLRASNSPVRRCRELSDAPSLETSLRGASTQKPSFLLDAAAAQAHAHAQALLRTSATTSSKAFAT